MTDLEWTDASFGSRKRWVHKRVAAPPIAEIVSGTDGPFYWTIGGSADDRMCGRAKSFDEARVACGRRLAEVVA